MARNGSGTYSLASGNPVVTGTTISSSWANTTLSDIATALTNSIATNGETPVVANLTISGYKLTSVGAGTARTDAASLATIQDGTGVYVATVAGTADAITLTPSPAITAYAAGQLFAFIASGANTGATTVNVSGLGAKSVTKAGTTALAANNILANALVEIRYDGTQFQLLTVKATNADVSGLGTAATQNTGTSGTTIPLLDGNNTFSGTVTMSGKSMYWAKGADIASAATLVLGTDGNMFDVTGSTGPTTAITVPAGMLFMLQFDSTPTLTHHATNLNLPGGTNITAAAGDRLIGFATAANTVHVINYTKASDPTTSEVRLHSGNGHGSTNTKIRRYTTTQTNVGTAITYADSATNGASFTINEPGLYSIHMADTNGTATTEFGVSVNSSELTTNIGTINSANRLMFQNMAVVGFTFSTSIIVKLSSGDVVRAHTAGTVDGTSAFNSLFAIRKISNA